MFRKSLLIALLFFASISFAAENYIQVPPDSTGKKTRTLNQTISAQDVHSSVVVIGNSSTTDLAEAQTDGTLPVRIKTQSTVIDTTTTPLGISATYTSPIFDTSLSGGFVALYLYADVSGTHKHDESHDGSTWRETYSEGYAGGQVMEEKHFHGARYVRYRFVNGGTAQTTFNHQIVQRHTGWDEHIGLDPEYNQIKGELTNNLGAPASAEMLGVLPAIASASAQSYTEGYNVLPRVTLSGDSAVTLDGEAIVLGAGTAGIGKLTVNDGVDVGDVTINNAAGAAAVNVQDGGNSLTIDNAALSVSGGGAEAAALRVTIANDSTGIISVDDNAGSLTVDQATAGNLNAQVVGELAHDAVDSGNPVKIGGTARNANAAAVANGDRVNATFDLNGRQIVKLGNPRGLGIQNTITLTTTTETTLLAAAASVFHDVTLLVISNSSATAVRVDIRDATAGTIRMSIPIAANGGAVISLSHPFEQTAVNNNWTAQLSAAVTDVRITAQALKNN